MSDLLKGIPIPVELGAFVALSLIFLVFVSRMMSELNRTLTRITDANRDRYKELFEKQNIQSEAHNLRLKEIAEEFQTTVRDLNRNATASQRNYQQQLQTLTDSHIKVSRESIAMLSEIKSGFGEIENAFRAQTLELEGVKRDIRDLKNQHLMPPTPPNQVPFEPG